VHPEGDAGRVQRRAVDGERKVIVAVDRERLNQASNAPATSGASGTLLVERRLLGVPKR
jgi:hypothetical protein